VFLFAFDLLELNGQDLRREALEIRKRRLTTLLRGARIGLQLNEHLEHEDGAIVFRHACKLGLEGIVSKRLGSRYRSGRSPDWLKMKNPGCRGGAARSGRGLGQEAVMKPASAETFWRRFLATYRFRRNFGRESWWRSFWGAIRAALAR
jgi:hypothetical protein